MLASPANDPILKRFGAALDELYGDRIERVVLFGSRARGDEQMDSDYDVAVFLNGFADRRRNRGRRRPECLPCGPSCGAGVDCRAHGQRYQNP